MQPSSTGRRITLHDAFLMVFAVILPPLAVFIRSGGCSRATFITSLLTICLLIPGIIYAWYVIYTTRGTRSFRGKFRNVIYDNGYGDGWEVLEEGGILDEKTGQGRARMPSITLKRASLLSHHGKDTLDESSTPYEKYGEYYHGPGYIPSPSWVSMGPTHLSGKNLRQPPAVWRMPL